MTFNLCDNLVNKFLIPPPSAKIPNECEQNLIPENRSKIELVEKNYPNDYVTILIM